MPSFPLFPRRVTATTGVAGLVAGLVTAGVASLALAPAADAVAPAVSCDATSCTASFGLSGTDETFVPPARISSVTVRVTGASGGSGPNAGAGGVTTATLAVEQGDSFQVRVGQQGSRGGGPTTGGGGAAGAGSNASSGGGGSYVSRSADGQLILAAGGGGGAPSQGQGIGGSGGGAAGGSGTGLQHPSYHYTDAGGGTQSAGGTGGTLNGPSYPPGGDGDTVGRGGGGSGLTYDSQPFNGGGGGGGGFHGGGGGSYVQAGGGGSGFVLSAATVTGVGSGTSSVQGDGSVTFTWNRIATTSTLSADPASGTIATDSVTLTATVGSGVGTPTGTVAFANGATPISGCGAVPVADGKATCTTAFANSGTKSLSATYSGSTTHAASTSDALSYDVGPLPTVTTASLPAATYGVDYSQTLVASGGTAPYTFAIADGLLPDGLTLSGDGLISGAPTQTGDEFDVTVRVTDAKSRTTTKDLTLAVNKAAQSVAFTFAPEAPTLHGSYAITETSKGAGTADLVLTGNDVCSVSGTTVSFDHAGLCTVTATQDGDDDHDAAAPVDHTVQVAKADQELFVTSNPPAGGVVGGNHVLSAAGSRSSAPVSIGLSNSTTNSACSLGPVSTLTVDGKQAAYTVISYNRAGTCVVTIDQGGTSDYAAATTSLVTIEVAGKATATTLTLPASTVVHGQPVSATATVTGATAGNVDFYVDGRFYDRVAIDGGTAISRDLAGAEDVVGRQARGVAARGLRVGNHTVTAEFRPEDTDTYADSETATGTALAVTPAKTTTTVKVEASSLTATVAVLAPSTDKATGTVTFYVAGKPVGTAELADGVATLAHTLAAGRRDAVSAVYAGRKDGDDALEVDSSSASTARTNPTVTVAVTSSRGKTRAGWYSRPATARFTCTAGSGAVIACPKPVTFTGNGTRTITRTVLASDGGATTVGVTVGVDHGAPKVAVAGVTAGRVYAGALPNTRCVARDGVSGIASCRLTSRTRGVTVTYTATATDRAGNTARTTVTVRRSPVLINGADYRGSLPVVRAGKGYTLVVTGKARPSYVYAAPAPVRPKGDGGRFTKIGKNRWAYSVMFTKSLRGHSRWTFGIKTATATTYVTVRVTK